MWKFSSSLSHKCEKERRERGRKCDKNAGGFNGKRDSTHSKIVQFIFLVLLWEISLLIIRIFYQKSLKFLYFSAFSGGGDGNSITSGNNKIYSPPNINNNNVELENLYKYYKSTGQVRYVE